MNNIKKLGDTMKPFNFKGFKILSEKQPDYIKTEDKEQVCEKHGKVICKTDFFSDGKESFTCPLCEEERRKEFQRIEEEEQKAELERARLRKIEYYKQCNIESKFYGITFDDYIPKSFGQTKAKEAVMQLVENKKGKVILLGNNGVGKTMLACIAAQELGGKIYSMYEISTMIRQSYTVKATCSEFDIVKELASIPFLAIDELGRTKCSESELNWLSYILDKRDVRDLPFMLMTNGHFKKDCDNDGCPMCFENFVNNDILSRLSQGSVFVKIKACDERKSSQTAIFWEDK